MGESKDEEKYGHEAETKSDAAAADDNTGVKEEGDGKAEENEDDKAEVEVERRELMLSLHSSGLQFELKEDTGGDGNKKLR